MNRLRGKSALIAGGASGIGFATARRFLHEGAGVVISDIDETKGAAASRELGREAHFLLHDVASESSWESVVDSAIETLGRVDVLVNCAGVIHYGTIEDTSFDMWRRTLAVNLDGTFLGCRAAVRAMGERGGSIVNLCSVSGNVGTAETAAYDASKGGVRLLTKSVALYCAREGNGIRCNSVHPGGTYTPMLQNHFDAQADREAIEHAWLATIPMGRFAMPEEIAGIVLYLASDEASFVTGAEFTIDGGKTAQ